MLTLTMPAEWESVAPNGAEVKRLKKAFDKRARRWFSRSQIGIAALWFLEFQERGAPHFHYMLWDGEANASVQSQLTDSLRKEFIRWVSKAWAEVVDHPDPVERMKHEAAGTRVERMRRRHFGYAMAYASKPRQKQVPEGFQDVGRFWGLLGFRRPKPIEFWLEGSVDLVREYVERATAPLVQFSEQFPARIRRLFKLLFEVDNRGTDRHYFGDLGFTAFGAASVAAVMAGP